MELSWSFMAIFVLVHYLLALEGTNAAADGAFGGNETDHLALLEFKAKIIADPLGVLSSWNASTHFCNWFGVTCSRRHQRRVTALDLSSSKLSGSISPHVANLSFLKWVSLQNNSFSHHIPPQFGNLKRLRQLRLHNNSLQGTIPPNLSACSSLNRIAFSYNKLVGEIPSALGSLSNLLYISFRSNNLTGSIPPSFGNLSALESLFVDLNDLDGDIPSELGLLTNLTTLALGVNRLSGTVPPSIFNLTHITTLSLQHNQFHGTLPPNLFDSLPNIQFFSIAGNQFEGSIPISLSNASNLAIFQANENKLHGEVPSLEKLHMLQALRLPNNDLGTGGIERDLIFLCSLTNATSLLVLALTNNNFGGALPECVGNWSTTLTDLWLDSNNITGGIPTGIGNLVNLGKLHLWNNKLSGGIPIEIGNLVKMQEMALNENMLSGPIPSSIGNLKLLTKLYLYNNNLQGSIPSNLSRCQNLILLSLHNNNLSGSIPPDVVGISSLSITLSLKGNQLSGALPAEVANLKSIGMLDLSDNLLSGEIPAALGSCVSLEKLLLGGNFFKGGIPSSLSSLKGVAELNFSHNNLSANIPKFLESFVLLQSLDLSYNNFDSMVPTEGVFKNTSNVHVEGNNELCGGVPELQLPKCQSKKSKSNFVLILVAALVSVLLVATLLLYLIYFCYFKKKSAVAATTSSVKSLIQVSYQDLLLGTDMFSSANMVGMGSFGSVYRGVLQNVETVVAVKVLNLQRPGGLKSFAAECEALKNIRHRNLVKVITACSGIDHRGNDFKALVYEFMVNGSLDEWLHPDSGTTSRNEEPIKLSFLQRLNIIIDVASALDYLHHNHQQSPIVHCDLKPSNILLDAEMIGHVGDFGLAKFLEDVKDKETSSVVVKGTIGYTPPEYGMGSKVSTSGDVYSYGILLFEVFTGKRPTDEMFEGNASFHSFVKEALPNRVIEILDLVFLEDADEKTSLMIVGCLISIFGIGVACSAELPRERLSINDALIQLSSLRAEFLAATV